MLYILGLLLLLRSTTCKDVAVLDAQDTTILLEKFFNDYDKKMLPSVNGEPISITVQMFIEDMVPLETINSHYSIDMYFRTYWKDPRLRYDNIKFFNFTSEDTIAFANSFVERIWAPDIFFPNGKIGKLHAVTTPNRSIRLRPDGSIFYSQRLTITCHCVMDLRNFPFDEQECEFGMLSFGYDISHIRIDWNLQSNGPIYPPMDKNMDEYTLADFTYGKTVFDYNVAGKIDTLWVKFHFRRNRTYYLIQVFIPCILIVILSWVSFWIDYRSTPARVALGITTVLTMATLGNSIRNAMPPSSHTKSLDIYLLVCFFYVFMALIEFAILGITDIKWKKIFHKQSISRMENESQRNKKPSRKISTISTYSNSSYTEDDPESTRASRVGIINPRFTEFDQQKLQETHKAANKRRSRGTIERTKEKVTGKMIETQRKNKQNHVVDRISRYVFPISFTLVNIIYFAFFLTRYHRHEEE